MQIKAAVKVIVAHLLLLTIALPATGYMYILLSAGLAYLTARLCLEQAYMLESVNYRVLHSLVIVCKVSF